jgi:hypothetical protein
MLQRDIASSMRQFFSDQSDCSVGGIEGEKTPSFTINGPSFQEIRDLLSEAAHSYARVQNTNEFAVDEVKGYGLQLFLTDASDDEEEEEELFYHCLVREVESKVEVVVWSQ